MAGIVSGIPSGIVAQGQFDVSWGTGETSKTTDVAVLGATSADELLVIDINPRMATDGLNGGAVWLTWRPTSATQITLDRSALNGTAPFQPRVTYVTVARVRRS